MYLGFYPAKIKSYAAKTRTARVHIDGLTDGSQDGLKATFAYPVGDDDKDTEREILSNADVYVFFEQGESSCPVIAFYRSHGEGAVEDVRRIRQENIELLARTKITLKAPVVQIDANLIINGDIQHTGNQTSTGTITGETDVVGGGKSLKGHAHAAVMPGSGTSGGPVSL